MERALSTAGSATMAQPSEKTILVIDDEDTICEFFDFILKREGFNVVTVSNGRSALERLKSKSRQKVDLVILDLMMPSLSGYEVLKELQNHEYQNVPVMIATAKSLDEGTVAVLQLESNVQSFWSKPIDQEKLLREIHSSLGTRKA